MSNAITAAPALPQLTEPFDALEEAFRRGVRSYLQELLELEVTEALGRLRHGRQPDAKGYRHGRRERTLVGRFGRVTLDVPRARLQGEDGRLRNLGQLRNLGHPRNSRPDSTLWPRNLKYSIS